MYRPRPFLHLHRGVGPFGLLLLVALLALIVLAAVLLIRTLRQRPAFTPGSPPRPQQGAVPFGPAAGPDPAWHELRLRYARGELDRADFLARAADLGYRQLPAEPAAQSSSPPAAGDT